MGLGGALIWTGLARNLRRDFPSKKIIFTYKNSIKGIVLNKTVDEHTVFENNDDIYLIVDKIKWFFLRHKFKKDEIITVDMDNPSYIYCEKDTNEKIFYKTGRHAIQIACGVHGINNPELKPKIVLKVEEKKKTDDLLEEFKLKDGNYICIEPHYKSSFTPNKAWLWDRWQSLADELNKYFSHNSLNIKIVQIGPSTNHVLDGVLNLTGKTSFREAAGILKKSLTFVSYEGGLAHLSRAVEKRGVVLISAMLPKELMAYPENINLYTEISCKNCGLKIPCMKGRECMEKITVSEVSEACKKLIMEILSGK